jgi:hypothetical protein
VNSDPTVWRSTHSFLLWRPGDDFVRFVRVKTETDRASQTRVFLRFPETFSLRESYR